MADTFESGMWADSLSATDGSPDCQNDQAAVDCAIPSLSARISLSGTVIPGEPQCNQTTLCAQGRQVVAPRKIINIRAQSRPVSFRLRAVVPFGHHLINPARAVHDLLHLRLCLQIIRGCIELAPQAICSAIQIVHGIFKIVF
jgi:hypothetical protein